MHELIPGFKSGLGLWVFKGVTLHSMISFKGEVKPLVPSHKILQHVEEPCEYERHSLWAKFGSPF